MIFHLNQSSGMPIYLQLMEQVKHGVEIGALRPGDQLPTIRKIAEDLVMNPNTVARAYRELEHEGIIELKHGSGAFIRGSVTRDEKVTRKAQAVVQSMVERLAGAGFNGDEIRRLVENELALLRDEGRLAGSES